MITTPKTISNLQASKRPQHITPSGLPVSREIRTIRHAGCLATDGRIEALHDSPACVQLELEFTAFPCENSGPTALDTESDQMTAISLLIPSNREQERTYAYRSLLHHSTVRRFGKVGEMFQVSSKGRGWRTARRRRSQPSLG